MQTYPSRRREAPKTPDSPESLASSASHLAERRNGATKGAMQPVLLP